MTPYLKGDTCKTKSWYLCQISGGQMKQLFIPHLLLYIQHYSTLHAILSPRESRPLRIEGSNPIRKEQECRDCRDNPFLRTYLDSQAMILQENIWMFPKIVGFPPKSSQFNRVFRVFHYKPSIFGYPYFWKHPYTRVIQAQLDPETLEVIVSPVQPLSFGERLSPVQKRFLGLSTKGLITIPDAQCMAYLPAFTH